MISRNVRAGIAFGLIVVAVIFTMVSSGLKSNEVEQSWPVSQDNPPVPDDVYLDLLSDLEAAWDIQVTEIPDPLSADSSEVNDTTGKPSVTNSNN